MNQPIFEIGDVVIAPPGERRMTAGRYDPLTGRRQCLWSEHDDIIEADFPEEELEIER